MTKNEFKIGDRVRFTGDYHHFAESVLEVGKEYTVVSADEYGCDLSVQCTAYSVDAKDLELVETLDRKTALLTELQELLRKYNARIYDDEQYKLCIGIGDVDISWTWGDKPYSESFLTPDNIMDFDKK